MNICILMLGCKELINRLQTHRECGLLGLLNKLQFSMGVLVKEMIGFYPIRVLVLYKLFYVQLNP